MERMPQGIMVTAMARVNERVMGTRGGSVRPKPGWRSSDFLEKGKPEAF